MSLTSSDTTVANVPDGELRDGRDQFIRAGDGRGCGIGDHHGQLSEPGERDGQRNGDQSATAAAAILLPASVTLTSGNSMNLSVTLGTAAPPVA